FNEYLAEAYGGTSEVSRSTRLGRRVHDVGEISINNVTELAIEGKNYLRYRTVEGQVIKGEVPLTPEIRQQIYKDVLWMREGRKQGAYRLVQWEFAGAGPSEDLAAALRLWGLPYVH